MFGDLMNDVYEEFSVFVASYFSIVIQELNEKLNTFNTDDNERSADTAQRDIITQVLSKITSLPEQAETT